MVEADFGISRTFMNAVKNIKCKGRNIVFFCLG